MNFSDQKLGDLLDGIASRQPTPGGGAVAGLTAAIAASLGTMVVNYSVGRASLAAHDALHCEALERLESMRTESLALAEQDTRAYARLNELWKLDKNDDRRRREFQPAVREAISAPARCLTVAQEFLKLLVDLSDATNPLLASDLAIAAILGEAAAGAAAWNVRVNLPLLDDESEARELEQKAHRALEEIGAGRKWIEAHCAGR